MHNLLEHRVMTVRSEGQLRCLSLPELLHLLAQDGILDFPALRPHQAPSWHAFLVQLAFLATEGQAVPTDASGWAAALRALTPGFPGDEPWCLMAPPALPAFLQPAIPDGDIAAYGALIATPDELDPLVTSKNHDQKAVRMRGATPEEWLFALVNLQTAEGVMGAGKYGIMRMNGGYGSRPQLGFMPSGARPGARFKRDLTVLRRSGNQLAASTGGFATDRELKLLWLEPWDGTRSLPISELHPLVIELCRRIRLLGAPDGGLMARGTGSAAARIQAKELRGVTGDPWAPIETDKDGAKVLSVTADGFGWQRMREILMPVQGDRRVFKRSLLAFPAVEDGESVDILAAALARGQGKTEGFHTRRITVSGRVAITALSEDGTERQRLAALADELGKAAMTAANRCLRPALFLLFQKGPAQAKLDRPATGTQVAPWMQRFDRLVDAVFFPTLWPGVDNEVARIAAGRAWLHHLHKAAEAVFEQAAEAAPSTDQRRIFAAQRARNLLHASLQRNLPLPEAASTPETADAE